MARLLLLTGSRRSEVEGLELREIDRDNRALVIPADRMKAGRPHTVPLPPLAWQIVADALAAHDDDAPGWTHLFTTRRMLGRVKADLPVFDQPYTLHDWRRSFATNMANRDAANFTTVELCLAHAVGSTVARVYNVAQLFDQRRALLDDWADLIAS